MAIKRRTVSKSMTMDEMFRSAGVEDAPEAHVETPYTMWVKTPNGHRRIKHMFRTKRQPSARLYFRNNTTLECSHGHLVMTEDGWVRAEDLTGDHTVVTETGTTSLKSRTQKGEKVLYDIEVESDHCYYANGTLSHNSWFLAKVGHACMMAGGMVAHYTLELDDKYTGRRYDSIGFGHSPSDVPDHRDEIVGAMDAIPGDLSIRRYPTRSVTVQSIHAHFERLSTLVRRPDLIVLDYADLLKSAGSRRDASLYETGGDIYLQLRRLAGELEVPVWTVSQSNREGAESEVITANMIADSFAKVMHADFVASIARTSNDKVSDAARFHIIKNRFGPDGMTLPALVDTSCGRIEMYDPASPDARRHAADAKMAAQRRDDALIGDLYAQFKETGSVPKNSSVTF